MGIFNMSKHINFIDFTADSKMLLARIHPEAAEFMSEVFSDLAGELTDLATKKKAARLEKVAQITQRRHIDVMVAMLIDAGKSQQQAITELQHYGISAEQICYLWKHIKPRVYKSKLKERQRTARRMRRNGYSNSQIARALDCSTRTVQRLL